MNNYPKHVGDFIRDTVGLSMLEEGAYNRLLDQYYAREGPLPADKATLYRLARCTDAKERKAVDYVLQMFFTPGPDGWHQKRADTEITKFHERREAAQRAGLASADARRTGVQRAFNGRSTEAPTERATPPPTDDQRATGSTSQKPVASSQYSALPQTPGGRAERAASGSRLPADWALPPEWRDWALQERPEWPSQHVERVGLEFRDYWHGRAGKDGRRADWLATWRNWIRREKSAPRLVGGMAELSPVGQQTAANLARWLADEEAKDKEREHARA